VQFGTLTVADHHPALGRSASAFYQELIDQAVVAEQEGYESFWVAEHHFHEYGIVPAPAVLLSAIAQRTSSLRLGTSVVVCPFHDPRSIAEQYALLDVLSDGRFNFGAGSGYLAHEFAGFGVDPSEKRERFDEALDIIRRLWRGEHVTVHRSYNNFDDVAINVQPLQQPQPPTWIAAIRAEVAPFIAARGERIMGIPYALERIGAVHDMLEAYHAAFVPSVENEQPADATLAWHTYVGESSNSAIAEARSAMEQYTATRLYATAQGKTFEELHDNGLLIIGDASYCIERIGELGDAGMTRMLTLTNFGALPHDRVVGSMKRFAAEVIPAFASA
jgi:alkanesulfonate monooxygenase SsuD/methylene tetrahydromethanopterin reductase-like flavin-dependent oxidoreductase (luciferase family)